MKDLKEDNLTLIFSEIVSKEHLHEDNCDLAMSIEGCTVDKDVINYLLKHNTIHSGIHLMIECIRAGRASVAKELEVAELQRIQKLNA